MAETETEKERLDRELIELLNEIRVALPGIQVLFAFLLLLPFQQTFRENQGDVERAAYFVALLAALAATVFLIAPTTFHRIRFRERDKLALITISNRLVLAASACLGISLTASTFLVTDILYGPAIGAVTAAIAAAFTLVFWYAIPLGRKRHDSDDTEDE